MLICAAVVLILAFVVLKIIVRPKVMPYTLEEPLAVYAEPFYGSDRTQMAKVGMCAPEHRALIFDPSPSPIGGCTTLVELLDNVATRNWNEKAFGKRKVLGHYKQMDGEKYALSDTFSWLTYGEQYNRVKDAASGIVDVLGGRPDDIICIFAASSLDWITVAHAAHRLRMPLATVYPNLGSEGLLNVLQETQSKLAFVSGSLLKDALDVVEKSLHTTTIIVIGNVRESVVEEARKRVLKMQRIRLITFEEVTSVGRLVTSINYPRVLAANTAIIMYTSGTTGRAKGVVLSHRNILTGLLIGFKNIDDGLKRNPDRVLAGEFKPRYLSYLPLSHIFEFITLNSFHLFGGEVAFGSPGTLTALSPQLMEGSIGDLRAFQPDALIMVPAILEKIYKGLKLKVSGNKALLWLLEFSLNATERWRIAYQELGFVHTPWIWNKLFFQKVQHHFGGNVQIIFSGGAPLTETVQSFAQTAFDCPIRQGYALTETACCGTCSAIGLGQFGVVGGPMRGCVIKLIDWKEGGYLLQDQHNPAIGRPRGEILVGGPCVSQGYFQRGKPDKNIIEANRNFFTDEAGISWFCTGDIGEIHTGTGILRIIDRKKDIVKLSMGEYVAVSKVENLLKQSKYVEQVLLHVKPTMHYSVAIVVPSPYHLMKWAACNGFGESSFEEVCMLPEAAEEVNRSLEVLCSDKVKKYEIPKKVLLSVTVWSSENGLLTGALKLKRPSIIASLREQIDSTYL